MAIHPLQLGLLLLLAGVTVASDMRTQRISNVACLLGIVSGLALHGFLGGPLSTVTSGLSGMAVGFLLFLPFYALKGMAAGDVKLMAAVGSIVGFPIALLAAGASLIAGTVLGIAYLVMRGGWSEIRTRYWLFLKVLLRTGRFELPAANADAASRTSFPYALAIAVGSIGVSLQSVSGT